MDALAHAKNVAEEILEMTKGLTFSSEKEVDESEVEAYVQLLDNREALIFELTDLRQQIDGTEATSPEFSEVTAIIKEITALDEHHLEFMRHMKKNAQASYRDVKQGQRIAVGYNPMHGDEAIGSFDVKQ